VFGLAIAQHEERIYVELAKVFEKFVQQQAKVRNNKIIININIIINVFPLFVCFIGSFFVCCCRKSLPKKVARPC
jgi:hypothetical protein